MLVDDEGGCAQDWAQTVFVGSAFDLLLLLESTKICSGAIKYENRYGCDATRPYCTSWLEKEVYIRLGAEQNRNMQKLMGKYEPCRALSALMSPLFL